jgi:O-antigen/teichoic acid export membrane protein
LNGSGAFVKQAIAVFIYSGSKLAAVVMLVAMGVGVKGALLGNAGASVAGLAAARLLAGPMGCGESYPMRKLVGYVSQTAVLAIAFTLLVNLDVFLVKAFLKNGQQVGAYVAASTLAKAPFFLFLAIAGVTLPSVSRAIAGEDERLLRVYVNQSFRLHLMLLMPLTAIVSAGASGIVRLVYRSGYDAASTTLAVLITAYMFWGLLNGVFNLMVADRQTKYPVAAALTLAALMVVLCGVVLASTGIIGAAWCALAVSLAGLTMALIHVRRRFGCLIPCASFFRITAASIIAYMVTKFFSVDGLALIGVMVVSFAAYILVLIMSREITRQDFVKLASVTRN